MSAEIVNRIEWLIWLVSWLAVAAWSDRTVARAAIGSQVTYRLLTIAGAVLLMHLYRGTLPGEATVWRAGARLAWIMDAVAAAGFGFTWRARLHLGRFWSSQVTRKVGHRIVDTGPYGMVRHPIYAGLAVATLATIPLRGTTVALAGAGLLIVAFYIKARVEERFLRGQLGAADYDAYARRVPMLVPFARWRRPA